MSAAGPKHEDATEREISKRNNMNLLCQGAGGLWTGLGWATPLVGRLLLGHTVRQRLVGSTGHYQDSTVWCVSRFIGSDPTKGSCGLG